MSWFGPLLLGGAQSQGATISSAAGAAAGVGATSAVGIALKPAVGSAAGVGAASGTGGSTAAAVGSAAGTGAASGVSPAATIASGAGAAAGVGATSAIGIALKPATGAAAGTGAGTGVGAQIRAAVGSAAGVGQTTEAAWDPATLYTNQPEGLPYLEDRNRRLVSKGATGSFAAGAYSKNAKASGKYYAEFVSRGNGVGISNATGTIGYVGQSAGSLGYFYDDSGSVLSNAVVIGNAETAVIGSQIVGVAIDVDNKKVWFRLNAGLWNNSGTADPATNVGGFAPASTTGSWFFAGDVWSTSDPTDLRSASADWTFAPPAGFGVWYTVGSSTAASVGNAAGSGATGAISVPGSTGTASGQGAALAIGTGIRSAVGAAAGTGAAPSVGIAFKATVGAAAGIGSAVAQGSATAASTGLAAGVGAASGQGASTRAAVGSAGGTGTATGITPALLIVAGIGTAAGLGATAGIGRSTASAVASAAGVGSAIGMSISPRHATAARRTALLNQEHIRHGNQAAHISRRRARFA